jgi:hypothetical protein
MGPRGLNVVSENFCVAGGSSTQNTLAYSYDGLKWSAAESAGTFADGICNAVGWNGACWVAGGVGESALMHSSDGIHWQQNVQKILDSGQWRSVPIQRGDAVASLALNANGDLLAVGSPPSNVSLYAYGAATHTWLKTVDLSSNDSTQDNSAFGQTVVLNTAGTRVIIGSPMTTDSRTEPTYPNSGTVYTFDLNGTTWGSLRTITNNGYSEQFGSALAINNDGTRLLVGAPTYSTNLGIAYSYDLFNNNWVLNPIALLTPIFNTNSNYGTSVAINGAGSRCLIGEPNYLTRGKVYCYDFSYNAAIPCWGLKPPFTQNLIQYSQADQDLSMNIANQQFGYSLTMDTAGVRCAIGAPGSNHVYLYDYAHGQGWALSADMSGTVGERFGYSVKLNSAGTRLLVGAPGLLGPGQTYVYNYMNQGWVRETPLLASAGSGRTLASNASGDRLATSAFNNALIFDRQMQCDAVHWNGSNWTAGGQSTLTTAPLATSNDGLQWEAVSATSANGVPPMTKQYFGEFPDQQLGNTMAFNAAGTRLVIGCVGQNGINDAINGVYIYDYDLSLNKWPDTYTAKFTMLDRDIAPGSQYNSSFGTSISLNAAGDRLAIGAFNATPEGISANLYAGAVYIYHYTGQWSTTPTWTYYETPAAWQFGYQVKFNAKGDRLAVSAYNNGSFGYIYVFHYDRTLNKWPGTNGQIAVGATQSAAAVVYVANVATDIIGKFPFGFNAAGDRLAVGTNNVQNAGALYIIHYNHQTGLWPVSNASPAKPANINTVGIAAAKYSDVAANGFGVAAAFNAAGDTLAVAAPMSSPHSIVYIIEYNYATNAWPPSSSSFISACTPFKPWSAYYSGPFRYWFGSSLQFSADGNRLLIGSYVANTPAAVETLYVLDRHPITGWPAVDANNTPAYLSTLTFGVASVYPGLINKQATYVLQGSNPAPNGFFAGAMDAAGTRIAGGNYPSSLFGTKRGYVNIYDLATTLQLESGLALTTVESTKGALAGGGGVSTVFAASPNGLSWTNITDDRNVLYNGGDGRPMVRTQALQSDNIASGNIVNFGDSIVINKAGMRLAVSAPVYINTTTEILQGEVYIYNYAGGWQKNQKIANPNPNPPTLTEGGGGRYFGDALCMNDSGSKLVIQLLIQYGNPGVFEFMWSGDVYSYNYVNGQYVPDISRIVPHTYVRGDRFGAALAMNAAGTKLVVGAYTPANAYTGTTTCGRVYCYNYDAQNGWLPDSITPMLLPINPNTLFTHFGQTVAMNSAGTQLTVSEPLYSFGVTNPNAGQVYCYTYGSLTGWRLTQDLSGGLGAADNGQQFGSGLAMNSAGTWLLVGARLANPSGKVYSYNYGSNGQWVLDTTLSGYQAGEQFGATVALNAAGDRLSVGAPLSPQPSDTRGGKVYNYVYNATNKWQKTFDLVGSVGGGLQLNSGKYFGTAIALNGVGNRLLIGQRMYDASMNLGNNGTGIVYSYDEPFAQRQCNALASNENVIVAGGQSIRNPLAYSLDGGETWDDSVSGGTLFAGADVSANIWGLKMDVSYNQCNAVAWNGTLWVAGGLGPNALAYSYDGLNWLPISFTGLSVCNALTWNGTYWIAGGLLLTGLQGHATSADGIHWSVNADAPALGTALAARREPAEGNYFAGMNQIALGSNAGLNQQGANSVAVGKAAGQFSQGANGVAVGYGAGQSNQRANGVAVGNYAGNTNQGVNAVAVGYAAGQVNQQSWSVAVGTGAGQNNQAANSVAMGLSAGQNNQGANSVAMGNYAGQSNQGVNGVAIGNAAGILNQGKYSVAIGSAAGLSRQDYGSVGVGAGAAQVSQGQYSTALGFQAAAYNQGNLATALGYRAGYTGQQLNSVAMGVNAGSNTQGSNAVAIGYKAGSSNQGCNSVAVGNGAGDNNNTNSNISIGDQAGAINTLGIAVANTIAIGTSAGKSNQRTGCVAIGVDAGTSNQEVNSVAIGSAAGKTSQGESAVAIGISAGFTTQGSECVAIGVAAGSDNQKKGAIAIGRFSGKTEQQTNAIAIGFTTAEITQQENAIAIGYIAGYDNQQTNAVAIGTNAGKTTQQTQAVAIGLDAGKSNQQINAVAIGPGAGLTSQQKESVAIGLNAGNGTQQEYAVAVGPGAGQSNQQTRAVAIGYLAGYSEQKSYAVAVGPEAGKVSQETCAVAIGTAAGSNNQKTRAVAIGDSAGRETQGEYAVAIGYQAGYTNQAKNSICINANGSILENTTPNSCVIAPIRNVVGTAGILEWNWTGEVSYNSGNTVDTLTTATSNAQSTATNAATAASTAQTTATNAATAASTAQTTATNAAAAASNAQSTADTAKTMSGGFLSYEGGNLFPTYRAQNTWYYNGYKYPIFVNANGPVTFDATIQIKEGIVPSTDFASGDVVSRFEYFFYAGNTSGFVCAIIPPAYSYTIVGFNIIYTWYESH